MKTRIDSNRFPERVKPTTLMGAEIDPGGADEYEVSIDLHVGDRSVHTVIMDVTTAKELGVALIEQATISTAAYDAKFDVLSDSDEARSHARHVGAGPRRGCGG